MSYCPWHSEYSNERNYWGHCPWSSSDIRLGKESLYRHGLLNKLYRLLNLARDTRELLKRKMKKIYKVTTYKEKLSNLCSGCPILIEPVAYFLSLTNQKTGKIQTTICKEYRCPKCGEQCLLSL